MYRILVHVVENLVAPHEGAWIEIRCDLLWLQLLEVAPHEGAWIEMLICLHRQVEYASPLTKGRGLKCRVNGGVLYVRAVAPHEGAWIEIGFCHCHPLLT